MGRLYYNASNPYGCETGSGFLDDFDLMGDPDGIITPIIMVKQSNCSYVTQTRNIEMGGGALAIIIDTLEEDISDIILSDDGTGAGIRIPAMLISKSDGEALINYIIGTQDKETALTAEFLMEVRNDNKVEASLWYSSSDDRSLDFIKNMADYIEPIISSVNFEPKFVTWACPHCDWSSKRTNCVSDGKYCAMQHDANVDIDGKDVVMENLRQHCIY